MKPDSHRFLLFSSALVLFIFIAVSWPQDILAQDEDYYIAPVQNTSGFGNIGLSSQKPGTYESFWDSGGMKRVETLDKDLFRHGEYKEWYESGVLKVEEGYEHGLRSGVSKRYYENGTPEIEASYIVLVKGNGGILGFEPRSFLHGVYTEFHANGQKKKTVNYEEGVRQGPFQEWYDNGQLAVEGTIHDNFMVGVYQEFHRSGSSKIVGEYVKKEFIRDGTSKSEKEGLWTLRHDNGQIEAQERYVNGELIDGPLTYYHANGEIRESGEIEKGLRHGPWTSLHDNGQLSSKKEYRFGQMFGELAEFYPNGQPKTLGSYGLSATDAKKARKEGLWTEWYENGQTSREVTYTNGRREGPSTEWYANGQKKLETTFWFSGQKESMFQGSTAEWYENGQLKYQGMYDKGRRDGDWKEYYPDGQLRLDAFYDKSKLAGKVTEFYANGQKKSQGEYRMARIERMTGEWKRWYEDGTLKFSGAYASDKLQGICRWYSPEGQLVKEILYDTGDLVGFVREYYSDGSPKIDGNYCSESYLKGLRCGQWKVWDQDGNLVKDEFYKKGKLK